MELRAVLRLQKMTQKWSKNSIKKWHFGDQKMEILAILSSASPGKSENHVQEFRKPPGTPKFPDVGKTGSSKTKKSSFLGACSRIWGLFLKSHFQDILPASIFYTGDIFPAYIPPQWRHPSSICLLHWRLPSSIYFLHWTHPPSPPKIPDVGKTGSSKTKKITISGSLHQDLRSVSEIHFQA